MITSQIILAALREFLAFLIKQWKYVVIVVLSVLLFISNGKYRDEVIAHQTTIEKHKEELQKIKEKHLEKIIEMKEEVIKSQEKISEVHRDYQDKIDKQSVRTEVQIKEIEKHIPSVVRESCDFGTDWLYRQNDYIRSSNNPTSETSN
jgi:TolA-binding protein